MTAHLTCTCPLPHPRYASCEVTIAGRPDMVTGMVMNIVDLKELVRRAGHAVESRNDDAPLLSDLTNEIATALVRQRLGLASDADSLEVIEAVMKLEDEIGLDEIDSRASLLPAATDRRATPHLVSVKLSLPKGERWEWRSNMQTLLLTRTYDFCAGHRLAVNELSEAENKSLFGKCENPHGHNFGLEITVCGDDDMKPDLLIDTQALDAIVEQAIVDRYDHQFLNDHEDFCGLVPTCETMCRVIWDHLQATLLASGLRVTLHRIGLRETPRNFFEYFGEQL